MYRVDQVPNRNHNVRDCGLLLDIKIVGRHESYDNLGLDKACCHSHFRMRIGSIYLFRE